MCGQDVCVSASCCKQLQWDHWPQRREAEGGRERERERERVEMRFSGDVCGVLSFLILWFLFVPSLPYSLWSFFQYLSLIVLSSFFLALASYFPLSLSFCFPSLSTDFYAPPVAGG